MISELAASFRKELLVSVRSWRVLAYSLFLAAVILLGASLPLDSFPYELSLAQGPLVLLLVLGCAFIFASERGTTRRSSLRAKKSATARTTTTAAITTPRLPGPFFFSP